MDSYETMVGKIRQASIDVPAYHDKLLNWLSEHTIENHEETFRMVDSNFSNRRIFKHVGKRINDRGGFYAMQACFYILANFILAGDDPQRREKKGGGGMSLRWY